MTPNPKPNPPHIYRRARRITVKLSLASREFAARMAHCYLIALSPVGNGRVGIATEVQAQEIAG